MIVLSPTQQAFLALHVKRIVLQWKWYFQGSTLRASAGSRSASISLQELADLLARDLMTKGHGESVMATAEGRGCIVALETI